MLAKTEYGIPEAGYKVHIMSEHLQKLQETSKQMMQISMSRTKQK